MTMNDEEDSRDVALTTIDNPFDPFDEFDDWYQFDVDNNYLSCSKIARVANIEDYMSNTQKDIETEKAIDRIIEIDPFDIYIKVVRDKKDTGGGV